MFGVFAINLYIGLYDTYLSTYNSAHYYFNWIIAIVDIVSAIVLLLKPRSLQWVALGGIVWPVTYLLSLVADIATSMCLGTPNNPNCWPSPYDSFKYLVLGDPSEGWTLWQYTIPTAIALLVVIIILSGFSIKNIRAEKEKIRQDRDETHPSEGNVPKIA
jgi:hypothetical protein